MDFYCDPPPLVDLALVPAAELAELRADAASWRALCAALDTDAEQHERFVQFVWSQPKRSQELLRTVINAVGYTWNIGDGATWSQALREALGEGEGGRP